MSDTDIPEPTPEQAALFARVRRMMLIASVTTAVAIAAVLVAVGYRLFTVEGSASAAVNDVTAMLPKGARISRHGGRRRQTGPDAGRRRHHRNPHLRRADAETRREAEIHQRAVGAG